MLNNEAKIKSLEEKEINKEILEICNEKIN